MNENLNLVEILKDCPKGTKLYSPLVGEVELVSVSTKTDDKYPICITYCHDDRYVVFTKDGRYEENEPNGECLLFPSKDQRDWSKFKPKKPKFDPKTLNPFDKVLARKYPDDKWYGDFVSTPPAGIDNVPYTMFDEGCKMIIPYNEDTKHLVGTTEEAPEYYRYWED